MTQTPSNGSAPLGSEPFPPDRDLAGGVGEATGPDAPLGDPRPVDPASGPSGVPGKDPLRSSRTGRAWVSVVALGVVLVLLIVFIAQNTRSVTVSFLGWQGQAPLAVALLIATVAGLFLAAVAGTMRIWQLRRRVRRESRQRARA